MLGCTELPLVLNETTLREHCDDPLVRGLVLVNPTQVSHGHVIATSPPRRSHVTNPTQVLADHALWAGLTELHGSCGEQ